VSVVVVRFVHASFGWLVWLRQTFVERLMSVEARRSGAAVYAHTHTMVDPMDKNRRRTNCLFLDDATLSQKSQHWLLMIRLRVFCRLNGLMRNFLRRRRPI
jgi:hypothetical protein